MPMKPKVLLPPNWKRYEKALEILKPVANVQYIVKERFDEQLAEAEGMVGYGVGEEILQKAPKLKVVARYGVGYDDCDVEALTRHKIYLTYTPGVLSDAVADMTIALLLACNRKIVQADRYVREGWAKRAAGCPGHGVDLKGKTMGIIGLGRIGYKVAKRCVKGFDMKVIYYDIRRNERAERELGAERKSLEEVMRESDFVSIHLPLTPQTRGLIGEKYLIPPDDPLLKLENVVLTPHIASLTKEARESMAICNAKSIAAVLKGDIPPPNVVPEQEDTAQ